MGLYQTNDLIKTKQVIHHEIKMDEPNDIIEIFSGKIQILIDGKKVKVKGNITFEWLPFPNIYLEAKINTNDFETIKSSLDKLIEIIFNGEKLEGLKLYKINEDKIFCRSGGKVTQGKINALVDKVEFCITNYETRIYKELIYNDEKIGLFFHQLETDNLIITLGFVENYMKKYLVLNNQLGYLILANGYLHKKDDQLSNPESSLILTILSQFLTFLNGRWCSICFQNGKIDKNILWKDYSVINFNEGFSHSMESWVPMSSDNEISFLWDSFYHTYIVNENHEFINLFMIFYTQSCFYNKIENAIIFSQTALELIYNWQNEKELLPIEQRGKNEAYDKIIALLNIIGIDTSIPNNFTHLKRYIDKSKSINDAVRTITSTRNKLIHSGEKNKIKSYNEIPYEVKHEIMELTRYYIELSFLKFLNYNGKFYNRCTELSESVPWVNN